MRIAFMGTSLFAVPILEMLIEEDYEIAVVYTQPDRPAGRGRTEMLSPVKGAALKYDLPIYQPVSLRNKNEITAFSEFNVDLVVLAAFGLFLPKRFLELQEFGNLNVHPSLLPLYRGPSPIMSVLLQGDEETGSSIFLMDARMDSGPILTQKSLLIDDEETTRTLTDRLARHGAELLRETIPLWLDKKIDPQSQDRDQASYTELVNKADGLIDWSHSAFAISREVRAFDPWPSSFTYWEGKRLKISKGLPIEGKSDIEVGTIITGNAVGDIGVVTGDGILLIDELQIEGKGTISVNQFLNGYPRFLGARLTQA
jgi:methionyl-tRNA formyltransferase